VPQLKKGEQQKEVKVQVTGGIRFATVSVEAQSIPLKKSGAAFKGSRSNVVLKPEDGIAIQVWFKGGHNAKWEMTVGTNGKEVKKSGNVTGGSFKHTFTVMADDFGLGKIV
jgi:hypothetical protein